MSPEVLIRHTSTGLNFVEVYYAIYRPRLNITSVRGNRYSYPLCEPQERYIAAIGAA